MSVWPARCAAAAAPSNPGGPGPSFAQRAKTTLRQLRFASGTRVGTVQLSPCLTARQRRLLKNWLELLAPAFSRRLPQLKIAVADDLLAARRSVFINQPPTPATRRRGEYTHAASFIPERYIVLGAALFRQRVELGRILYHELCHFVWPRLGNPRRRQFQALLSRELRQGVRGELGYSSEHRKAALRRAPRPGERARRDYVCESFCDTGSYVLLEGRRRARHSEYTLSASARRRRCRLWSDIVLK